MARSPRLHFVSTRLSLAFSRQMRSSSMIVFIWFHHSIIIIIIILIYPQQPASESVIWFFFVMYKNASSSILRAASSRSFRSSSLTPSSSAAASPCSLLGQRSFATSSPAFRSLPRWSHCLHSRPSPFGLTSQIRTASPVLDRLQRNFSSMGNISLSLSPDLPSISPS